MVLPVNSVKAMRACCWLRQQGPVGVLMEPFAEAVFEKRCCGAERLQDCAPALAQP